MPRGRPKKPERLAVEAEIKAVTPDVPAKKESEKTVPHGTLNHQCTGCNHPKDQHYGSAENWCNKAGCKCQAWKS